MLLTFHLPVLFTQLRTSAQPVSDVIIYIGDANYVVTDREKSTQTEPKHCVRYTHQDIRTSTSWAGQRFAGAVDCGHAPLNIIKVLGCVFLTRCSCTHQQTEDLPFFFCFLFQEIRVSIIVTISEPLQKRPRLA